MEQREVCIDLHLHSNRSDGTDSPAALARLLAQAGVGYAALTDHDTVSGVEEFLEEAQRLGIAATSGVELNVACEQGELHLLGYGMDIHSADLLETLEYMARQRAQRARRMVHRLCDQGVLLDYGRVAELAGSGVIGRPHLARALVERGYCDSVSEAFERYLGAGKPGYVPRALLERKRSIEMIHRAGGLAVLAHPGLMEAESLKQALNELCSYGLDGLEVYYPLHSDQQVAEYLAAARKRGLVVTQGSDYHGITKKGIMPGCEARGEMALTAALKRLGFPGF